MPFKEKWRLFASLCARFLLINRKTKVHKRYHPSRALSFARINIQGIIKIDMPNFSSRKTILQTYQSGQPLLRILLLGKRALRCISLYEQNLFLCQWLLQESSILAGAPAHSYQMPKWWWSNRSVEARKAPSLSTIFYPVSQNTEFMNQVSGQEYLSNFLKFSPIREKSVFLHDSEESSLLSLYTWLQGKSRARRLLPQV